MKECAFCGKLFEPQSNKQIYCKSPHYMTCPVCGKEYLVTNNENLKRPPVACSYACRAAKTRKTSLEKYGTLAPGNNPEARKKAKATMQEKYGVDYAMQSEELRRKAKNSLVEKYGVDNIRKLDIVSIEAASSRRDNWLNKVHSLLPIKTVDKSESPRFKIDETKMSIYILTEKASTSFLSKYGFRYNPKFGKIHLSIGLVNDGILYQVIRFEKVSKDNKIILADFGTRDGYFNSNYYSKLMNFAVSTRNIEQFEARIPRNVASREVIDSLHLELVSRGDYEVYWKMSGNKLFRISDSLVKLTQKDNIEEMLKKHDYITTDYMDNYKYAAEDSSVGTKSCSEFIIQNEHLD